MTLEVERECSRDPLQRSAARRPGGQPNLAIGLVNNMPDGALEATEAQFTRLLSAAADSLRVRLRFSFLPEVPRSENGRAHLGNGTYWPIETLLREPLDALIVTGMEPVAPLLSDEPYWARMGELIRWAEVNTTSSIWSCLAAHAAVEQMDGIRRQRMTSKLSGVFAHTVAANQPLLQGVSTPVYTPHSRWNELPVDALRDAGYTILTSSPRTGADLFIKQSGNLAVFFQGHPEYEEVTLLREYRRDVGRYLRGEQQHYPKLPHEYFSPTAVEVLSTFEKRALEARSAELLTEFPAAVIADTLNNTWSAAATRIYRNWLVILANAHKSSQTRARTQVT
jgi:homoserine O-succinyltransferase/O-acetyltransferase